MIKKITLSLLMSLSFGTYKASQASDDSQESKKVFLPSKSVPSAFFEEEEEGDEFSGEIALEKTQPKVTIAPTRMTPPPSAFNGLSSRRAEEAQPRSKTPVSELTHRLFATRTMLPTPSLADNQKLLETFKSLRAEYDMLEILPTIKTKTALSKNFLSHMSEHLNPQSLAIVLETAIATLKDGLRVHKIFNGPKLIADLNRIFLSFDTPTGLDERFKSALKSESIVELYKLHFDLVATPLARQSKSPQSTPSNAARAASAPVIGISQKNFFLKHATPCAQSLLEDSVAVLSRNVSFCSDDTLEVISSFDACPHELTEMHGSEWKDKHPHAQAIIINSGSTSPAESSDYKELGDVELEDLVNSILE